MPAPAHRFNLSIELFPPRSLKASFKMWRTLESLVDLNPDFISVTYGAGGTTRELSQKTVEVIASDYNMDVAGHLTCVGSSKTDVLRVAREYYEAGARRIVALRGDPGDGQASFVPHKDGFSGSVALIESLAEMGCFDISVAAYPEKHPESQSLDFDISLLQSKFSAGATSGISQFFFEAETFLRFRDKCERAGVTKPVYPGILPIENWEKTRVFAQKCGALVPDWMDKAFSNTQNKAQHDLLSTAICTEMCDKLLSEGVEHLHFYTLNDPALTETVCTALGRPKQHRLYTKVA